MNVSGTMVTSVLGGKCAMEYDMKKHNIQCKSCGSTHFSVSVEADTGIIYFRCSKCSEPRYFRDQHKFEEIPLHKSKPKGECRITTGARK